MNIKVLVLELPLIIWFKLLKLLSHILLQLQFNITHFAQLLLILTLQSPSLISFLLHEKKFHLHRFPDFSFLISHHLFILENSLSMLEGNFLNFSFFILYSSNCFSFSDFKLPDFFEMQLLHFIGELCQLWSIFLSFFHSNLAYFEVS